MLRERDEHLTPAKVAKRAELDTRTVERVEKGEGETTWNVVGWIADAIGVSMKEVSELEEAFMREEEQEALSAEGRDDEGEGIDDESADSASGEDP
jgi:transcriptional regulator with XRE-family HTH domain